MDKIKLYYTKEHNSFNPYYFEEFMRRYFDLRPWDESQHKENILIGLPYNETINKILPDLHACHTIIVDNLLECDLPYDLNLLEPYKDKILVLTNGNHTEHPWLNLIVVPDWFWYFESPWYHSRQYHLYSPKQCDDAKLFYMPIRRIRRGRDLIYEKLQDLLPFDSIYSYVERGIDLPGIPLEHKHDQRWFNPSWYDSTLFSVVNEDSSDHAPKIYTEKICKPLAFYHPFILVAQAGVLKMIKSAGFETFPELFDESYDDIESLQDRVEFVHKQIRSFDRLMARSPTVLEKLQYNHERFFDLNLVYSRILKEVVDPVIEFVFRNKFRNT